MSKMRLLWPPRRGSWATAALYWCLLCSALALLSLWLAGGNFFDCGTRHHQPLIVVQQQLLQKQWPYDLDIRGGGGGNRNGLDLLLDAKRIASAAQLYDRGDPDVVFRLPQTLIGALLLPVAGSTAAAATDGAPGGDNWTTSLFATLEHNVTLTVVAAFSPRVEEHARLMFEDKFGECRFHAMGPAMAAWRGAVVACVRLFLPQYLLALRSPKLPPIETWQENYVYAMRLRPDDYEPLEAGRLLGIPAPTNSRFTYRKDGPMDPRAFVYRGRLFLIYYSYSAPSPNTTARCRMYFWDYERSVKRVISVSGLRLQQADINWSPLVVGGDTLYLIYTFDPLRVLHCDPDVGHCTLHYAQPGAERFPFDRAVDALRGGTPFVEYAHPYYVSIAHSAGSLPYHGTKPAYAAHVVIVRVDAWRLVYVSGGIDADERWLQRRQLVLSDYVGAPFWYPTALLPRDDLDGDAYDVGCHVNDHSSYVFRLVGLKRLLADVVARDSSAAAAAEAAATSTRRAIEGAAAEPGESPPLPPLPVPPPPRAAQRFVIDERRRKAGFATAPNGSRSAGDPSSHAEPVAGVQD